MASQTVIEKLKELQSELGTISSAVVHINDAAKVAKSSSEILGKIPVILNTIKDLEEKHRSEILKSHLDKVNRIENKLQNMITEIKGESELIIKLVDETKKLEKNISEHYSEIKKIDFPERLGKIDNQISAINIGVGNLQTSIQNTQAKIENIQSSVISKLSDLENKFDSGNIFIAKEIKENRIITISIGVALIIIMLIILFKLL